DTGRERPTFADHREDTVGGPGGWPPPLDVALSPDGRRLATRSPRDLRLWDARTGKPLRTVAAGKFVPGLSWSGDGKSLVAAGEGRVGWWNADTGALLRQVPLGAKEVQRVTLSADGAKLLCEVTEKEGLFYRRLDADTGKDELRAVPADGELKAISPDGKYYATASSDAVWLHAAGAERALWKQATYNADYVAFSPDGRAVVATHWSGPLAWETKTGRPLGPVPPRSQKLARATEVC